MIFRVCTVFGIHPKSQSRIMDLPLNFVQFTGYNLAIFYAKPSRKTLNKFGKPSRTLITRFYWVSGFCGTTQTLFLVYFFMLLYCYCVSKPHHFDTVLYLINVVTKLLYPNCTQNSI